MSNPLFDIIISLFLLFCMSRKSSILDKTTFKKIFTSHYTPLCNLAFRIIGDLDKAEDVVQDIFVKVWKSGNQVDENRNVQAYLYTMVRNHALEFIRRENIGQRITMNLHYLNPDHVYEDMDEEEIEKLYIIDQIYVSIRQLPPKCAEVFTLSKINGLTYHQIAELKGISVKTVENHMTKALKILRELLKNIN